MVIGGRDNGSVLHHVEVIAPLAGRCHTPRERVAALRRGGNLLNRLTNKGRKFGGNQSGMYSSGMLCRGQGSTLAYRGSPPNFAHLSNVVVNSGFENIFIIGGAKCTSQFKNF